MLIPRQVHIESALTNMSQDYGQKGEYIWRKTNPIIKVTKTADKYYIWDEQNNLNLEDDSIGPNGDPNESEAKLSSTTYCCVPHAHVGNIPQETIDEQDPSLDVYWAETQNQLNILEIAQEKRSADIIFAYATYDSSYRETLSSTRQWGDSADTPLVDIRKGLYTMDTKCNLIVMGALPWMRFCTLPEVQDAVYHNNTGNGIVSLQQAATIFGIPIIVGEARYNSANPGKATVKTNIWGNNVALLHVEPNPTRHSKLFAGTFCEQDVKVIIGKDTKKGSKSGTFWVKPGWNEDIKVISQYSGYIIKDAAKAL